VSRDADHVVTRIAAARPQAKSLEV
jgi:hypothetical protein